MGEKQYSLWIDLFWLGTLWLARGRGPRRVWSPRAGSGTGSKPPPRGLTGTGISLPRGDGDGEAIPDGEFPVAISSSPLASLFLVYLV